MLRTAFTRRSLLAVGMIKTTNQRAFSTQQLVESSISFTEFLKGVDTIASLSGDEKEHLARSFYKNFPSTQQLVELKAEKDKQLEKLEADKDKQLEKLEADKDKQLEKLEADKDKQLERLDKQLVELEADKDKQLVELKADKMALIQEKLKLKAQFKVLESLTTSFRNMRPILENYVRLLSPQMSTTEGMAALVDRFMPNGVLNQDAKDVMIALEGEAASKYVAGVTADLKALMHRLSVGHYFPDAPQLVLFAAGK